MRQPLSVVTGLALAGLCLTCCNRPGERTGATSHQGRYEGLGIYTVGQMWTHIAGVAPTDAKTANLKDDENIIVVVDTNTGEVRQCGNISGYCVAMNPWSRPLTAEQLLPSKVDKHIAQVSSETQAARDVEASAAADAIKARKDEGH
jgi:hypothetical protein